MLTEVTIKLAVQTGSTNWEITTDKGIFEYTSDSGDVLNLIGKIVDADIVDNEIKFITVPVYVGVDEHKEGSKVFENLYKRKMANGCDIEFKNIKDSKVGKFFCLSSSEKRSMKSSWIEMKLMDAAGRVATARLFTEEFGDYTNRYIIAALRPNNYGFIAEEVSILEGIEKGNGQHLVHIKYVLDKIKERVPNEKIVNFFNEEYLMMLSQVNAGIELEKLVLQIDQIEHSIKFMDFLIDRAYVYFLFLSMLQLKDLYIDKTNMKILDETTQIIMATIKEKIFSTNVISLFLNDTEKWYVEKSIVKGIRELSERLIQAKYYFTEGEI